MWHEFAAQTFDAIVYDPRHFGNDGDKRWESADGAAAWARQCLLQAEDSGAVAVLMPRSAASSGRARALRRTLLRAGELRALVTGLDEDRDLWVLCDSDGERPQHVLLIDAAGEPARAGAAWRAFRADPAHPEAAPFAVRIIDRLDDQVDLTPVRAVLVRADSYPGLRAEYLGRPAVEPPLLETDSDTRGSITVGELVEAGAVGVHRSPPTVVSADGVTPMLTAKDIRLGRPPSRRGDAEVAGAVVVCAGDIAVVRRDAAVRICVNTDTLLGPGIDLVRADPNTLDPEFLAGVLRAAVEDAPDSDIDLNAVEIPRLPMPEQRRYATEFVRLRRLETDWQTRQGEIEQLVRLGYRGLATGLLRPMIDR
ncbi:hypothetical protein [Nocardia cyriacigeorgica]|uniref:hypothetical protein n=1 Tax=Nocardia cyriacigeorgica TaxID=135487 RepID=UPI0018956322|nr:hypothetical protein [Nocardia cyriacigeorgica]MBF6157637.1 hypothetical protein [Nocardia cyriacigeorgica]MBF6196608.1 hypothetical protein [Nocardia cyriacigeorgica]